MRQNTLNLAFNLVFNKSCNHAKLRILNEELTKFDGKRIGFNRNTARKVSNRHLRTREKIQFN